MLWASPAAREPAAKMASEPWTRILLSNRSPSLPQIGVVTVMASIVETTTHV